jgi:23S rRNA (adenine2503-C2)-methyltransferase
MIQKESTMLAMEDIILESGAKILYHHTLADVIKDGDTIRYAVFQSKSGLSAIESKVFIDATGDGDLAVLAGCDYYFEKTGRRITFEYSLVHGVNDRDEDANELIEILKPRNCLINLIPVNPIKERSFEKPSRKSAENFKNKLEKNGINVTIRREMGSDIDGACGQLRRRYVERK